MHYTPILTSLGYTPNDALKAQVKRCVEDAGLSVPDLDKIAELHESVRAFGGYVALSNSEDVFKVKCETSDAKAVKEFNLAVHQWGEDNAFKVKKLDGKEVFYITGKNE